MTKTLTPHDTVKARRLPKEGDELTIRVRITKTGCSTYDTADTVTPRLPGFDYPVTILAK